MTENHVRFHFSPFQTNTQLLFFKFVFTKWLSIAFLAISDQYATIFLIFFGSPICAKNNRVLPLCVINGYAKYEVDRLIYDKVREASSFLSICIKNGFPIDAKNHRFLVIWDLNGYGEYEFDWWQSYDLYKRWSAASAAETTAQPKT